MDQIQYLDIQYCGWNIRMIELESSDSELWMPIIKIGQHYVTSVLESTTQPYETALSRAKEIIDAQGCSNPMVCTNCIGSTNPDDHMIDCEVCDDKGWVCGN